MIAITITITTIILFYIGTIRKQMPIYIAAITIIRLLAIVTIAITILISFATCQKYSIYII